MDALICIYVNKILNLELYKYVYCDHGPWKYGCRYHFWDFTVHSKTVIEENTIFDNGGTNLHINIFAQCCHEDNLGMPNPP